MKFYVVDDESDLRNRNDDSWCNNFDSAKQFTLKEARAKCDEFNNSYRLEGKIGTYYAMIPIPKGDEKEVKATPEIKYLIWSFTRAMYWNPNQSGYTKVQSEAGLYSKDEAVEICTNSNVVELEEAMVPYVESAIVPTNPDKDAKYYLLTKEGMYWLGQGRGSTTNKAEAHPYSFDVANHWKAISGTTMEKVE